MAGEWTTFRLGDVCTKIGSGVTPRGGSSVYLDQGDVALIRSQNIYNRGFHHDGLVYLAEKHADELANVEVAEYDVLLNITGDSVARACQVHPDVLPARVNQHVAIIRPDPRRLSPRYLRYYLVSPTMQAKMLSLAGAGATRNALTKGMIESFEVPAPTEVVEQEAIACILGALDDKIELNRRMNETLEQMARAIFKSWFVDFDPVRAKAAARREHPDWTGERVSRAACPNLKPDLAALFPDGFEDSELGEIPEGWEVGRFGDVAENPRRGIQPGQIEASTPYIALEHMPKRCIALSKWGTADGLESNKFEFRTGEILFGKLRPYFHKVGVAPVDGVCSTDIVVVVPRDDDWFGFVLCHISSDAFVEYTNAGSTGTKMPRTSWNDMARYPLVIPPKPVAEAFTKQVRPAIDRIIAGIHECRTLGALRDALLPKLLSGEIRVKDPGKFVGDIT